LLSSLYCYSVAQSQLLSVSEILAEQVYYDNILCTWFSDFVSEALAN